MEIMAPPGMEEMTEQIKSMFSGVGSWPQEVSTLENQRRLEVDDRGRSRQTRQ